MHQVGPTIVLDNFGMGELLSLLLTWLLTLLEVEAVCQLCSELDFQVRAILDKSFPILTPLSENYFIRISEKLLLGQSLKRSKIRVAFSGWI